MTVEHGLPKSWSLCRLGDVVDYGSTEKAEPDQIPADGWVLELEDIEKDTSRILRYATCRHRGSKSVKNVFARGDVLYGKLRPYLNKVVRAEANGFCTTEIVPLRETPVVSADYLFWWLKHPIFMRYVTDVSHGLNMPRLGTDAGRQAPFVLAPMREQLRIAQKLESLNARSRRAREALDAVPPLLEKLRQSILAAAFRGDLTKDWRAKQKDIEPATELLKRIRTERRQKWEAVERARLESKGKPPADDKWKAKYVEPVAPDFLDGERELPAEWAWASVGEITECLDSLRQPITRDKRSSGPYPYYGANGRVDSVAEYLFDEPLVLVTEDETFYGRTKPIAYLVEGKCWVNNHAHVLRSVAPITPEFVCQSLMHYRVERWLSGTTGRAKLTQGALNSLPIALPPLAEIHEIGRRVAEALSVEVRLAPQLAQALANCERLDRTILAKAFRGELVPQDPDDEPAEAMLARARSANGSAPADGASPRRGRPRAAQRAESPND